MVTGFLAPHWGQKLPVFTEPQAHCQEPAGTVTGFLEPHWAQKLPVLTAPQVHFQLSAAGAAGAAWACCWAPI